jgi:hypothetical protein
MSFRISGLPAAQFAHLFGRDAAELAALGVRRCTAHAKPGYPCRVTLADAEPGESVLLLNYVHQPADSPFRASHAIYVREGAATAADYVDAVPRCMRVRPLSVRAFDGAGMMLDADLTDGAQLEASIARLLANEAAAYLHVHYAKPGCFAARVDRVG